MISESQKLKIYLDKAKDDWERFKISYPKGHTEDYVFKRFILSKIGQMEYLINTMMSGDE